MSLAQRSRALALALGGLAAWSSAAQEPSLGEAAQREKARRAESGRRASGAKVYTNEDLEAARQAGGSRGNLNLMDGQVETGSSSEEPSGERGSENEGGGDQAQWAERGREARAAVEAAEAELASRRQAVDQLRAQLSPMAQPYVQDQNERLRRQADLTEAERAVARAQDGLTQARERMQQLLQDAQRQRIPAGWISNPS